MCLYRVTKHYPNPSKRVIKAWKILAVMSPDCITTPFKNFELRPDRWLKARQTWILPGNWGKKYRTGFHCYPTLKDAKRANRVLRRNYQYLPSLLKVKEVRVSHVTYRGTDGTCYSTHDIPNLVAQRMFVPGKEKKRSVRKK